MTGKNFARAALAIAALVPFIACAKGRRVGSYTPANEGFATSLQGGPLSTAVGSATNGTLLMASTGSAWTTLTPGPSGSVLMSNGPGTSLVWTSLPDGGGAYVGDASFSGNATSIQGVPVSDASVGQGSVLYLSAADAWAPSPAGSSSGQFLENTGTGVGWASITALPTPSSLPTATIKPGGTTVGQFSSASTDYLAFGASPPTTGYVRFGGSGSLLEMTQSGSSRDALYWDGASELTVGNGVTLVALNLAVQGDSILIDNFYGGASAIVGSSYGFTVTNTAISTPALSFLPNTTGTTSIQFAASVTSSKIVQTAATSDVAPATMVIQAQGAYPSASTHQAGADLQILGGAPAGTSSPGYVDFHNAPTATAAASGTASALPATPAGYVELKVGGAVVKLPYFN